MRSGAFLFLVTLVVFVTVIAVGFSIIGIPVFSSASSNLPVAPPPVPVVSPEDEATRIRKEIIERETIMDPLKEKSVQAAAVNRPWLETGDKDTFIYRDEEGPIGKKSDKDPDKTGEKDTPSEEQPIVISFELPFDQVINVKILDAGNAVVRNLVKKQRKPQGQHQVTWDRKDNKGTLVEPGQYTFQVTAELPNVPVLIYHHLALPGKGFDENEFTHTPDVFEAHMKYLKDNGFSAITINHLADYLRGTKGVPEKPVVITFDDGYQSYYRLAYPILKNYNLKSTLFVLGAKVEHQRKDFIPTVTWAEIKELHASGLVEIQSHTYDLHDKAPISPQGELGNSVTSRIWLKSLNRLETEEEYLERLENDFRLSAAIFKEKAGLLTNTIAWPYGHPDAKAREIGAKYGYTNFVEGYGGINQYTDSPEHIKRTLVPKKANLVVFEKLVRPSSKLKTVAEVNFTVTGKQ